MEDKRITEADFEELVCEIWRTKIENKRNDYRYDNRQSFFCSLFSSETYKLSIVIINSQEF